jgi:ADP-heptose:LPS heptosyltransferase
MTDRMDINTRHNILIPRFDTFGDIVLLEGFVRGLLHLLPKARVTLLVRQGYDQLSTIFPQRLIWKTTRIDPYEGKTDPVELSMFLRELKGEAYDLVLFTAYNRTWLDDLAASILSSSWRVGLGDSADMPDYLNRILPDLDMEIASCPFDEFISVDERSHETEKYQILWERLTGEKRPLPPPELSVSKDLDRMAEEVLAKLGLADETYYICSPAGIANVPIKFWPEENHAEIIAYLEKSYHLRALVVGYETEEGMIEKVINGAKQKGAHSESWLGKDGDIPLACALAKRSSFYFGNDTGLMHMSAALDKPVLAIFGGGTWPRFLPRAKTGRAFVSPMPCFYCRWDCFFDKALCLRSLSAYMVLEQLREAVEEIRQGEGEFKVVEERVDYDRLSLFFDKAVGCLRASAGDRATRLKQIEEMGELLQESEADREARLEQIEELGELLQESEADRAARLEQIEKLGELLQESEADRAARLKQIEELTVWLKESESDRAARLKVMEAQQAEIEAVRNQVQEAEEGWRNLEQSFTVRQARKIGLIRAKRFDLPESSNSNKE